jgi:hypothetical protein
MKQILACDDFVGPTEKNTRLNSEESEENLVNLYGPNGTGASDFGNSYLQPPKPNDMMTIDDGEKPLLNQQELLSKSVQNLIEKRLKQRKSQEECEGNVTPEKIQQKVREIANHHPR